MGFVRLNSAVARHIEVHPTHPQPRLISMAAEVLRGGGLIAYPTDSCYALGCHIGDKDALQRLRQVRGLDERHHVTLMCRDLSEIASYARVDNAQYRLLRHLTPGSYAFILEATRELPRRLLHPKRKTIGLRIPDHPVALALLENLGEPILSCTALIDDEDMPPTEGSELMERLGNRLDLVLDAGHCGTQPCTVIDLSGSAPQITRVGKGDVSALGIPLA